MGVRRGPRRLRNRRLDGRVGGRRLQPVRSRTERARFGLFNRQCLDFTSSGSSLYDHVQDRTTVGAEVPADAATGGSRFTLLVPGNSAGQFSCDQNPDGGLTIGMTFGEATATYSTTGLASITPCAITI